MITDYKKLERYVEKGIARIRTYEVVCGDFSKVYRNLRSAVKAYFNHYNKESECYVKDTYYGEYLLQNSACK